MFPHKYTIKQFYWVKMKDLNVEFSCLNLTKKEDGMMCFLKFFSVTFFAMILTSPLSLLPAQAQSDITIELHGKVLTLDQPPVLEGGRTLIPVRGVMESLGAEVLWVPETRSIDIKHGNTNILLTLDQKNARVNNQPIELDVPPMIVNNRTVIPVRFVVEHLGLDVYWVGDQRRVVIGDKISPVFFAAYKKKISDWVTEFSKAGTPLMNEYLEKAKDNSYSSSLTITPHLSVQPEEDYEDYGLDWGFLKNLVINIQEKLDLEQNVYEGKITAKNDEENFLDISLVRDKEEFFIKYPKLFQETLSFSRSDLDEIMDELESVSGLLGQQNSNITAKELKEALALEDQDFKNILSKMDSLMKTYFANHYFTTDNEFVKLGGEQLHLKRITLQMTDQEVIRFMQYLANTLKEDDELHGVIAKRILNVMRLLEEKTNIKFSDNPLSGIDFLSYVSIKSNVAKFFGDFAEEISSIENAPSLSLSISLDNEGKIVKEKIFVDFEDDWGDQVHLELLRQALKSQQGITEDIFEVLIYNDVNKLTLQYKSQGVKNREDSNVTNYEITLQGSYEENESLLGGVLIESFVTKTVEEEKKIKWEVKEASFSIGDGENSTHEIVPITIHQFYLVKEGSLEKEGFSFHFDVDLKPLEEILRTRIPTEMNDINLRIAQTLEMYTEKTGNAGYKQYLFMDSKMLTTELKIEVGVKIESETDFSPPSIEPVDKSQGLTLTETDLEDLFDSYEPESDTTGGIGLLFLMFKSLHPNHILVKDIPSSVFLGIQSLASNAF
jgi:hypothetical protein